MDPIIVQRSQIRYLVPQAQLEAKTIRACPKTFWASIKVVEQDLAIQLLGVISLEAHHELT